MSHLVAVIILSLLSYSSTATFISRYNAALRNAQNIRHLAATESQIITKLLAIEKTSDEFDFFLDFLLEDTGYNRHHGEGMTIEYPVDRFKVVERLIYDWEAVAELDEVKFGIMAEFERHASLPTADHLLETVRDLNEAMGTYYHHYGNEVTSFSKAVTSLSSPGIKLNPGNLLVLTLKSHEIGHVIPCVRWGDAFHEHLHTSPEPFTAPGDQYWVDFYLVYLECLVAGREGSVGDVRREVASHYRGNRVVMSRVEEIARGSKMERVNEMPCVGTEERRSCHYEVRTGCYGRVGVEQVIGSSIMFYRGVKSPGVVRAAVCPAATANTVIIDNTSGYHSARLVMRNSSETVEIRAGDVVKVDVRDVTHLCNPPQGFVQIHGVNE